MIAAGRVYLQVWRKNNETCINFRSHSDVVGAFWL
jgi:hypothetical protein